MFPTHLSCCDASGLSIGAKYTHKHLQASPFLFHFTHATTIVYRQTFVQFIRGVRFRNFPFFKLSLSQNHLRTYSHSINDNLSILFHFRSVVVAYFLRNRPLSHFRLSDLVNFHQSNPYVIHHEHRIRRLGPSS